MDPNVCVEVLKFCLKDIGKNNSHELDGLLILPMANGKIQRITKNTNAILATKRQQILLSNLLDR